ncbi:MAG: hypothetical protein IJR99_05010 [Kiritimatiellae bacterium]|nr:hypothetical protein [Kiritimatiellia bacterium]
MNAIFQETVLAICKKDPRYSPDAYTFIMEGLDYTLKNVLKLSPRSVRHVSGQELASGLRQYAIETFGPLALTVLTEWGIHTTDDFGHLVMNLVDAKLLSKQESDSIQDFHNLFDFDQAFNWPDFDCNDKP